MKEIKRISLSKLADSEIRQSDQKALKGGCWFCRCGCEYEGPQEGPGDDKYGGSSTGDNSNANDGGCWYC